MTLEKALIDGQIEANLRYYPVNIRQWNISGEYFLSIFDYVECGRAGREMDKVSKLIKTLERKS